MSNSVTFLVKDTIILHTLEQLLNHYIDLFYNMQTLEHQKRVKGRKDGEDKLQDWILLRTSDGRSAEQLRLTAASAGAQTAEKVVKSSWKMWDAQPAAILVQGRTENNLSCGSTAVFRRLNLQEPPSPDAIPC